MLSSLLLRYAIKQARLLHGVITTSTHYEEKKCIIRSRINPKLTDQFLVGLFETRMLSSIAWGSMTITLDHGDVLEIPKLVLQAKRSHIIQQYKQHCQEIGMQPLSDRTLHYFLESIKASEQKALSGIDDFVKEAHEAWMKLQQVVSALRISKTDKDRLISSIQKCQLYLKSTYVSHCMQQKQATIHCLVYALSQQSIRCYDQLCTHRHHFFVQIHRSLIVDSDFLCVIP